MVATLIQTDEVILPKLSSTELHVKQMMSYIQKSSLLSLIISPILLFDATATIVQAQSSAWKFSSAGAANWQNIARSETPINLGTGNNSGWEFKEVGDVTGNGVDDILWLRKSDAQVVAWQMRNAKYIGSFPIHTPVSSDVLLKGSGDVTGDGVDDIIWQHYE